MEDEKIMNDFINDLKKIAPSAKKEPHPSSEEIVNYVLHDLDPETALHVRMHSITCRDCFRQIAALQKEKGEEETPKKQIGDLEEYEKWLITEREYFNQGETIPFDERDQYKLIHRLLDVFPLQKQHLRFTEADFSEKFSKIREHEIRLERDFIHEIEVLRLLKKRSLRRLLFPKGYVLAEEKSLDHLNQICTSIFELQTLKTSIIWQIYERDGIVRQLVNSQIKKLIELLNAPVEKKAGNKEQAD